MKIDVSKEYSSVYTQAWTRLTSTFHWICSDIENSRVFNAHIETTEDMMDFPVVAEMQKDYYEN